MPKTGSRWLIATLRLLPGPAAKSSGTGRWLLVTLTLLMLGSPAARAVPVVLSDNLTVPSNAAAFPNDITFIAGGFGSGAVASNLTSVVLGLASLGAPSPLSIQLFAEASGLPTGSALATLTQVGPNPGNSRIPVVFNAPPATLLTANTNFFIVASSPGSTNPNLWGWFATNNAPGSGVGYQPGIFVSLNSGTTWGSLDPSSLLMQVNAETLSAGVPEMDPRAATVPLILCAGLGLLLAEGRRKPIRTEDGNLRTG